MRISSKEWIALAATTLLMAFFVAGHVQIGAQELQQQATQAVSPGSTNANTTGQATPGAISTTTGGTMLYPACPATNASGAVATVSLATTNATTTGNTGGSDTTGTTVGSSSGGGNATNVGGIGTTGTTTAGSATTTVGNGNATMQPGTGYLGIRTEAVENCGVRVIEILLGTSGGTNQLQAGDVIVAIDGQALAGTTIVSLGTPGAGSNMTPLATTGTGAGATATTGAGGMTIGNAALTEAFYKLLQSRNSGDQLVLTVQRNGQQLDIRVTLTAVPPGMVTPAPATGTTTSP